jgi:drug/metabolite transporter (DMT)-like permease
MFTAEVFWGLMAPLTKDAMLCGVDGISIVTLRVLGACTLFWIASLFMPSEKVPRRDILRFAGAAVLGIATNQCLFTIGINYTSPIDASIVTTTMPIFAMVFSFLILKEPITWKKCSGVAIGFAGALMLILSSVTASSTKVGGLSGDLMCLVAQFSFALYLSLFNPLVRRYNVVTVNKWMFLFASIYICPFTAAHTLSAPWSAVPARAFWEVAFIVVIGTFVCYFLSIVSQRVLRPTVVSIYNYVQPIVSVLVSVLTGMGVFTFLQGLAIILVFSGVWLVTKSKSKRDLQSKQETPQAEH